MFPGLFIAQSLTPRILLLQTDVTRHIIYVQGERKLLFDILIYSQSLLQRVILSGTSITV
jgi:hypothetical protein